MHDKIVIKGMDDWVDFDAALFIIGRTLGILPLRYSDIPNAKALFWSSNPIAEVLADILMKLVEIGYILRDEETDKFKLNDKFELKQ